MTSDRTRRARIGRAPLAALACACALAGCANGNSSPSGLSARQATAAVPAPIPPQAMAEPPPEVPPGPPAKSYAYRGGRDPLTGMAATVEGAPEPLTVDANGDVVAPLVDKRGGKGAAGNGKAGKAWPGKGAALAADGSIVVQKGDTLSRIAHRYRVTVAALMSANGLTSANIVAGQRLVVPR